MAAGQTIAKRSALVKLSNISFYWSVLSGGAATATVTKVHNGGSKQVDVITGRRELTNIVVSAPYNPHLHQGLVTFLMGIVGKGGRTISIQDLDANDTAVGRPRTYTGCVLVRVTPREYDEESNDAARLETEWAASNVT